jgi:hypothetical protein
MAVYRCVLQGLLNGQITQNVVHFADGGAYATARATALCAEMRDYFLTQIKARQSNQMNWTFVIVYDALVPATTPTTLAINLTGAQTTYSAQMPQQVCILMRWRTATAGPTGRGRIYLPGVALAEFNNGVMTAAAITAWGTILGVIGPRYVGSGATSGFTVVVTGRSNPSNYKSVTAIEIGQYMATQRRRNIGVGI